VHVGKFVHAYTVAAEHDKERVSEQRSKHHEYVHPVVLAPSLTAPAMMY